MSPKLPTVSAELADRLAERVMLVYCESRSEKELEAAFKRATSNGIPVIRQGIRVLIPFVSPILPRRHPKQPLPKLNFEATFRSDLRDWFLDLDRVLDWMNSRGVALPKGSRLKVYNSKFSGLVNGFSASPVEIQFIDCQFGLLIVPDKIPCADLSACEVENLVFQAEEARQPGVNKISLLTLEPVVRLLTISDCTIGLVKFQANPDLKLDFERCNFFYDASLAALIPGDEIATMIGSCTFLLELPSLAAHRDVLQQYKAQFESQAQWFKRWLFWFNGGYYRMWRPAIVAAVSAAAMLGARYAVTGDLSGGLAALATPTRLFGFADLVLADLDPGLPVNWGVVLWKTVWTVGVVVWTYSLFSFGVAVKRRFGYGRSES